MIRFVTIKECWFSGESRQFQISSESGKLQVLKDSTNFQMIQSLKEWQIANDSSIWKSNISLALCFKWKCGLWICYGTSIKFNSKQLQSFKREEKKNSLCSLSRVELLSAPPLESAFNANIYFPWIPASFSINSGFNSVNFFFCPHLPSAIW